VWAISLFRSMSVRLRAATGMLPGRNSDIRHLLFDRAETGNYTDQSSKPDVKMQWANALDAVSGGGRGIRTPKGLAARWISSSYSPCSHHVVIGRHRYLSCLYEARSPGGGDDADRLRTMVIAQKWPNTTGL